VSLSSADSLSNCLFFDCLSAHYVTLGTKMVSLFVDSSVINVLSVITALCSAGMKKEMWHAWELFGHTVQMYRSYCRIG